MIDLRCGDCLELMPEIKPRLVDLILADLPYGTTACAWDVVIPFGPLWENYRRLLKPCGAVVLTASQPFTSMLVMSNPEWFRYCWVWDKVNRNTNYGNVNYMPLRRHEDIVVFSPGGSTYNPQMEKGIPYVAKRSGERPGVYQDGGLFPRDSVNNGTRFPVSILSIEADRKIEMGLHPTQKPVALMEYLIRTYSNPGDTVLDNCMGSGTTGVACINTERHFIGMEKGPDIFADAEARIREAQAATPLFDGVPALPTLSQAPLFSEDIAP